MIRIIVPIILLLATAAESASAQMLITAAANVRLRAAPGTGSATVTMLPLGTGLEIADSIRDGEWIQVRTLSADTQHGWIDQSLTLPISDSTYRDVIAGLIASRLEREGDGFVARTELLELIEAVLERDWTLEERARLELQRFRALNAVLQTIPFYRSRWDDRLASWVTERSAEVTYSEPGGHWMIERDLILERHTTYRSTEAADEIAWFAVLNGLSGECEGQLVCYLEWSDRLEGEYLRREPDGRHVEEAAARIDQVIEYYRSSMKSNDFDAQRECDALRVVIDSLEAAVRESNVAERSVLASELRSMMKLCP
jgi:hypothetical protein